MSLKELAPGIRVSYIEEQLDKLNMSSDLEEEDETEEDLLPPSMPHHKSYVTKDYSNTPLPKPPADKIYSCPVKQSPELRGAERITTKYDSLGRFVDKPYKITSEDLVDTSSPVHLRREPHQPQPLTSPSYDPIGHQYAPAEPLDSGRLVSLYSSLRTEVCVACRCTASVTSVTSVDPTSSSRSTGSTRSRVIHGVPVLVMNKERGHLALTTASSTEPPSQRTRILLTDTYTGLTMFSQYVASFTNSSPLMYTFKDQSGNSFTMRFTSEDDLFIIKLDECIFKRTRSSSNLNKKQLKEFKKSEKIKMKNMKIRLKNEKKIYEDIKKSKGKISMPCCYTENITITGSYLTDHCLKMVNNITP